MPLLPIDLQTMFSQMARVGTEQAMQRDVPPLYQAAQAAELVKRAEQEDKSVNQPRQTGEGPEKVKERNPRGERGKPQGRAGKAAKTQEAAPAPKRDVVEDPALGHHVDLVG
jgi:hypothetical protein